MVRIRLKKMGSKKRPYYRIVVQDSRKPRDGTTIEEIGIDAAGLLMDEDVRTTLAFVHTFADGDRDFSFYRNPYCFSES